MVEARGVVVRSWFICWGGEEDVVSWLVSLEGRMEDGVDGRNG